MAKEKKAPKVGSTVGAVQMKNLYDGHWQAVLRAGNFLRMMEREKSGRKSSRGRAVRKPQRWEVVRALPTREAYADMRRALFTVPVAEVIGDATSEIETVKDELREWYDNMSEGLQQTEKAQALDEAAGALENVQLDEPPDVLSHVRMFHPPGLDVSSRMDRVADAVGGLHAAADAIEEFIAKFRPVGEDQDAVGQSSMTFGDGPDAETVDVDWVELEDYAEALDSAADECENVDIPGMYG